MRCDESVSLKNPTRLFISPEKEAMRKLLVVFFLLVTLLFAGCTTPSNNPRKGGLLGGLHGISSGEYDRRVQERKNRISELEDLEKQRKQRASIIEQRKLDLKKEKETWEINVDSLDEDIRNLENQVFILQGSQSEEERAAKNLKKKLRALKEEQHALQNNFNQGKINLEEKEAKEKRLREQQIEYHDIAAQMLSE